MVYLVNRKYMLKISIKDNSKILEIENFSILDNIHIEKIMIKNIRKIKIGGTNTFNQSYLKITEMDNKETKMILSDDEIKEVCNSTVQNLKQIV